MIGEVLSLLRGDVTSDKIVPPSGFTARLTVFAAAAMALLAAFALTVSLSLQRVAENWADALDNVATIEVTSSENEDVARILAVLETTPGVAEAEEISAETQRNLLGPWLGEGFPLDALPLPRLISLRETDALDRDGLILRLTGEVPSAQYLTHDATERQVAQSALRLRILGWISVAVTGAVMAVIMILAASTALAANASEIATLRLIGATDDFITRAFVRRFTLRGAVGGAIGTVCAIIILLTVSISANATFGTLIPGVVGWILIALIPFFAALISFLATRRAALRMLSNLT